MKEKILLYIINDAIKQLEDIYKYTKATQTEPDPKVDLDLAKMEAVIFSYKFLVEEIIKTF